MADLDSLKELEAKKGFKMIHLNTRSLFKKIDQLRLTLCTKIIYIVTISETWLSDKMDTRLIDIEGYRSFRQDRGDGAAVKVRGGGLITYIKNDPGLDVYVQEEQSLSNRHIEMQWLQITRKHAKNILLCNIYRPPEGKVELAIQHLENALKQLRKSNMEIIMLGDLNIDYKNKQTPNYKKLIFFQKSNSLQQHIKTATRHTAKSSTVLDIALTSSPHIIAAGTININISDHQPIYIIRKKERNNKAKRQMFKGRSYRDYDRQVYMDNLVDRNWADFYNTGNVNEAWDIMEKYLTEEADLQCPIKSYNIKNTRPVWMTNELIEQMMDRDYFYRKAKTTKDKDDWNIAKHLRNQTNRNIRLAKADFINEQLELNEGNSAKFWRVLKGVMPASKDKSSNSNITLVNVNGQEIEEKENASYVNKFFINVGKPPSDRNKKQQRDDPNLASDNEQVSDEDSVYESESEDEVNELETQSNKHQTEYNKFKMAKIHQMEISKLISTINTSKSSGLTDLSTKLVKDGLKALVHQFNFLCNLSLETEVFPAKWKKALVIPIPKTGDKKEVSNYRPISLLPLPGKLLEKLVHTQLSFHLEQEDLLNDSQFGFRRSRSTAQAAERFLDQVYRNINNSRLTASIFIDFRKAFDCVQHTILLEKLKHQNLDNSVLGWVQNYLSGRQQRTLANNVYSEYETVLQGVPQGSVLGPLLYIIYANDIKKRIKHSGFTFYADDTVIYTKGKTFRTSVKHLQQDLSRLNEWCVANHIYLNEDKTKVMFYGS